MAGSRGFRNPDDRHGSDDLYRLDLRSSTSPRRKGEGGARCGPFRGLLVKQMVQMKNPMSGLLLEKGVTHTKRRLHKAGYFAALMAGNEEIDQSIRPLLKLSREHIVRAQKLDQALVSSLERGPAVRETDTLENGPRSRPDYCADLGLGDRRCFPLPVDQTAHQLLRAVRRGGVFAKFGTCLSGRPTF
jgi:hypothetical protein